MGILSHGSDLRLSPTLGPIVKAGAGTVRGALGQVAKAGFGAVQLDATLAGIRPRELGVRARKDLAALVAGQGLWLSGLDAFVPRAHFASAQHVDRAVAAVTAAIELAADLGRVTVSVALPIKSTSQEVKHALAETADGHGVLLAVHAEDEMDELIAWLETVDLPTLGAGLDPAAVLATGADPSQAAQRLGKRLGVARLGDWQGGASPADATRCGVGKGELDLLTYRLSVDLAQGRRGPVVLDLRQLNQPMTAATAGKAAWEDATPQL